MTIKNLIVDGAEVVGDIFVGGDESPILNKSNMSLNSNFTKYYYSKLDKVDKDKNFVVSYQRAYDIDGDIDTTKCFYSYDSFDEYYEIQKKQTLICKENCRWEEIIKENFPLVECYDLDAKINDKNERNINMFKLYNEIGEDAMIDQFKYYRKQFIELHYPLYDIPNEVFAISTACSNKKFSIHIAVRNNHFFENSNKLKIFMNNFDKFLSHDGKFVLDLSIYNKNHAMRMLGNTKYGQKRFLKKHRSCSNLDDKLFLFSYVQPEDKVYTIYDCIKPDLKIIDKTLSFDKTTDYNKMTILLPHIKDNITYSNWSLIGQVIYNISNGSHDGLEQFIEWSKKDYDDFDEDNVIKHWSSYKITEHNLGVLVNQVKKDDPEVLKDLFKKKQSPEFIFIDEQDEDQKIDDKYCWTDFDNDRKEIFNNYDELMVWFKKMFPLVCNKINIGKGCYLKNEYSELKYNPVSCYDLNKSTLFYYYTITKKGDNTISTKNSIQLGVLFEDSKLKTYSRVICKPNNNINKHEFNVWEKFKADVKIEYDMNKLKPLLNYILEIICDNQEILFKYMISWLRHICKKPQIKTGKVLVLQSKQRAGKGSFINWLMYHVFGKTSSYATNLTKLIQKFNSFLINKSLIVVDELPTTSTKFHNTFDILKGLITEPYLDVEYKGKESIQTDNLCNFIFSTNNEKSIKIEKDDGRYVVFKINESKIGDIEFWNYVHTNVFTEDMAIHFFNYLINIDDNDDILVSIHQIPETELKNKMKELSLNSMEIFIKLLKERNIDDFKLNNLLNDDIVKEKDDYGNEFILLQKIDINIKLKFKKQSLYNHYILWCTRSGETQMKQKYFNTILTEFRTKDYRYYEI